MPTPDMTPVSRFPDLEKPGRESLNQLLRLLILTTRGDILTRGVTYLKRLALGTAGKVLHSDGTDVEWATLQANEVEVEKLSGASYDDVQDFINFFGNRTLLSGGTITSEGDGDAAMASCTAWCKVTDGDTAIGKFFNFAGVGDITLTDLVTNFIYLYYNGGTPQVVVATSVLTHGFKQDHIFVAAVYRSGNTLHIHQTDNLGIEGLNRAHLHHLEEFAVHRVSGMVTTSVGTRQLAVATGVLYAGLNRHTTNAFNTSTGGTFSYWYYDGDLGTPAWVEVATQNAIDSANYNDVDTGLVAHSAAAKRGVHWVYMDNDGVHLHVVYGQDDYSTAQAELATVPSSLPPIVTGYCTLIAKIIVQKDQDTLYISYPWTEAFQTSLATDHGSLAGLGDDDHPQYTQDLDEAYVVGQTITVDEAGHLIIDIVGSNDFKITNSNVPKTYLTVSPDVAPTIIWGDDMIPDADNAYDLGNVLAGAIERRWKNLRLVGNLTDGTNSITIAELISKNEFTAAEDILVGTGSGTFAKKTPAELMAILSGEAAANFDMNTKKITSVVDPTANQDAATKKYVDDNAGVAAHAILDGVVHTDSVADAVTRGSIIRGNATPKWDEYALGTTGYPLVSDGTDLVYAQLDTAGIANDAVDATKIDPTAAWGASSKKLYNFLLYTTVGYTFIASSSGDSAFAAKINGAPVGTAVVYDTVTGNENSIKPSSAGYEGKLVLHNTTRGDSALIYNVDIGTNTITLTANAPGAWDDNDDIQVNSLTALTGLAYCYFDLDLSGFLPATAAVAAFDLSIGDTGAANASGRIHPFEEIGTHWFSKSVVNRNSVAGITAYRQVIVAVNSQKVCVLWDVSGAATGTFSLRCTGWWEEAAT